MMKKNGKKTDRLPVRSLLQKIRTEKGYQQRDLSEKTEDIYFKSKLANRLQYLLLRRGTNRGEFVENSLKKALDYKYDYWKEAPFINTAPVGPGCNWLSVGPRNINGRIKCLAKHPTDKDTLYAGAANGGVWKTSDSGQSWTPTMHDEASLAIGAIAIDPNDPDIIYAGTGEPVYLVQSGSPLPPGSTNLAWYYAGVGVYKSIDGGNNWTLTGNMENKFIYRIAVDPKDPNHVLCAGYSLTVGEGGLCRSIDGGTTWTTIINGIFTEVQFDPFNNGIAYAGQYNVGIVKSADGGASWTNKNLGLPAASQIGRISIDISPSNPNVIYAKIENDFSGNLLGVYRTTSAGENPGWLAVANPGVDSGFLWWCSYIKVDPNNSNIVYAGGVHVARSADGGSTWNLIVQAYGGPQPATHPDQHDLVFDPTNSNRFFIANDGGVFLGNYTGGAPLTNFDKVSTGLVVTQFYDLHSSSASRTMFGGGTQDNGSMISTGGQSWRNVYGADGGYMAFHPTDPYTVYAQTQTRVLKSTDGANNFANSDSGIAGSGVFPARVMAIDDNNPLVLFVGTDRVSKTANGGGAWSAMSPTLTGGDKFSEIAIAPSTSAVIYAGTVLGQLFQATDGGVNAASFVDITPTIGGWPTRWLAGIAVDSTDSNTLYVSFMGFNNTGVSDHVWKGVFSGTWTWTLISTGLPDVPVGAIVKHPATNDLFIATDIGVFQSTDDGASWNPFEAGLPNVPVVDIHLDPVRNILRAATHGRGMFQINLNGPCPQVDIYVRDNIIDTGEILPSPTGVPDPTAPGVLVRHYKSADIKVDAPPYDPTDLIIDGVEFDDPEHPFAIFAPYIEDIDGIEHNQPIRTAVNRVYVQVHNRGWDVANSVTVKLMFSDAGAGLPALPNDFWPNFPNDTFNQVDWKPIGTTTISNLLPNEPRVLSFNWLPPAASSNHVCLLAMIDSPQDPLLPQTQLNVDVLTRSNKHVTHRNTHPVNPPSPGGGFAWASLNFNNGFKEYKFFDFKLENITSKNSHLRMIVPGSMVKNFKMNGFIPLEMNKDEYRDLLSREFHRGAMSEYEFNLASGFDQPLIFEIDPRSTEAALHDVLIEPNGKIPAVFSFLADENNTQTLRFEVNQYEKGGLLGGSEFILKSKREDQKDKKCRNLRIVIEKVQILDDKDPAFFGKGEFVFSSQVLINQNPLRGRQWRLPAEGCYQVSDATGENTLTINQPVFEGVLNPGDELSFSVTGTELDIISRNEELVRFQRTFHGPIDSWLRSYFPGDEFRDPETMKDWLLWYRIEEIK